MRNLVIVSCVFVLTTGVSWGLIEMFIRLFTPRHVACPDTREHIRQRQLVELFIAVIWATILSSVINDKMHYQTLSQTVLLMKASQVVTFKVYPNVSSRASGSPVIFSPEDQMAHEFFEAIQDLKAYPSHARSTVASENHHWFIDIATKHDLIRIGFYIPAEILGMLGTREAGDFVVGGFYTTDLKGDYGKFQSRQLLKWYQKYSHLWLNPADNQ